MTWGAYKKKRDSYLLELGRLLDSFALIERQLILVLATTARVDHLTAVALFSGVRAREAVSSIKRLHQSRRIPVPMHLSDAFAQLTAINTTRDHLVHWGVQPSTDWELTVNNHRIAHVEKALLEIPASAALVKTMRADLGTINAVLLEHLATLAGRAIAPSIAKAARAPWRYRPEQSGTQGLPSPRKARKPPAPPKPSRG